MLNKTMLLTKHILNILVLFCLFSYSCSKIINVSVKSTDINILYNNKLLATLSGIQSNKEVICEPNNSKYCYEIDNDQSLLIDESFENFNRNYVKCSTSSWINSPDLKELCFDLGKDQWYEKK